MVLFAPMWPFRVFALAPLLLLASWTASAGLIKPDARHFRKTGTFESFQWQPSSYSDSKHTNPFRYDIFYYIPESLKNEAKVKALVFNHGGGASTKTRDGSIESVRRYSDDLMRLADELGFVAVLPSANGLNWGGHTVPLMKNLVALMRSELDIDPDRIGLSGHSMGGMGITRSYLWLADQFAFFMPQAAGMALEKFEDLHQMEQLLNKTFNVPYIHLQGTRDSFQEFVARAKKQQQEIIKLEDRYRLKSKLKVILYDTDHQYRYEMFRDQLKLAFEKPRNLYQKRLYGSLLIDDRFYSENNILFKSRGSPRYFWIQAVNTSGGPPERLDFSTKIEGNSIRIEIDPANDLAIRTKKLRVYLKQGMVDLNKNVTVRINGIPAFIRYPDHRTTASRSYDMTDHGFKFETVIDVPIPSQSSASFMLRRFTRSWGIGT